MAVDPQATSGGFNAYGVKIGDELPWFAVSSATSYVAYNDSGIEDASPEGYDFTFNTQMHSRIYSEELNFTSKLNSPWKWSAGAFLRDANDYTYQSTTAYPSAENSYFGSTFDGSRSWAGYGEIGRSFFSDKFEVSAGARYFHDDVVTQGTYADFDAPIKSIASATTPRAVVTWKPESDFTVYGSYGQGFRSGFPQANAIEASLFPSTQPDKLTNYEIGAKGDAFDRRLSYTTAVYYIYWKDVQQQVTVQTPSHIDLLAVLNGQSASGVGAEFSITARPISGVEINAYLSWNDLAFDHTVYSGGAPLFNAGDRLNTSPEFTAGLSGSYTFSLGASGIKGQLSASENYTSVLNSTYIATTAAPTNLYPGNSVLIARARASVILSDHWTTSLFLDNAANYRGTPLAAGGPIPSWDFRVPPRTMGIMVEYHLL